MSRRWLLYGGAGVSTALWLYLTLWVLPPENRDCYLDDCTFGFVLFWSGLAVILVAATVLLVRLTTRLRFAHHLILSFWYVRPPALAYGVASYASDPADSSLYVGVPLFMVLFGIPAVLALVLITSALIQRLWPQGHEARDEGTD
jgi:hypothetical protein